MNRTLRNCWKWLKWFLKILKKCGFNCSLFRIFSLVFLFFFFLLVFTSCLLYILLLFCFLKKKIVFVLPSLHKGYAWNLIPFVILKFIWTHIASLFSSIDPKKARVTGYITYQLRTMRGTITQYIISNTYDKLEKVRVKTLYGLHRKYACLVQSFGASNFVCVFFLFHSKFQIGGNVFHINL